MQCMALQCKVPQLSLVSSIYGDVEVLALIAAKLAHPIPPSEGKYATVEGL
jgi:hypothetical protein